MLALNIVFVLYGLAVFISFAFVLFGKKTPQQVILWFLVILFIPIFGMLFYHFLGRDSKSHKVFFDKSKTDKNHFMQFISTSQKAKHFNQGTDELENSHYIYFGLTKKMKVLNEGEETFHEIFTAIKSAKKFIHLEYYIIHEGVLSKKLISLLEQKSQEGVKVRLIYDRFGSLRFRNKSIARMRKVGIEVAPFLPFKLKYLNISLNYRLHRKLIVIDQEVVFVGGMNIADYYIKPLGTLGKWRDTHLKLEGDIVNGLHFIFLTDWHFVTGKFLNELNKINRDVENGKINTTMIASGPDDEYSNIRLTIFRTLNQAQKYIYLSVPYFMPDESIRLSLINAALKGVDVRILLPMLSESQIVKLGNQAGFRSLLKAGVKVYYYKSSFLHSKVLVIDDEISIIGSANFDQRSFDVNFELSIKSEDKSVAVEMRNYFLNDLRSSSVVHYLNFSKRSLATKVMERIAFLFSPQL